MTTTGRSAAIAALTLAIGAGAALAAAETRELTQQFPQTDATLRLANLAGRVDLVQGGGDQVTVTAVVHAEGDAAAETRKLLADMRWVKTKDKEGRAGWALSYPVDDYDGFHYPRRNEQVVVLGIDFGTTSTTYLGERVKIHSRRSASVPTLYADLKIAMPRSADLAVRNAVGNVRGGALEGQLEVDTGSGDVQLASFAGRLGVDTGSGDVTVGTARGETSIDTGSGDVVVRQLIGNGVLDTGSGDIVVEQVAAGKLSLDTGSGDVTVKRGTATRLIADTGSGSIRVLGVEIEELTADTGSGDVIVESSLEDARRVLIDTGSGDVRITAGSDASFDVAASQGSGELLVRYADADLRKDGKTVVGARRGDGKTRIRVETGSGDCVIAPGGQ